MIFTRQSGETPIKRCTCLNPLRNLRIHHVYMTEGEKVQRVERRERWRENESDRKEREEKQERNRDKEK